jgi:mannose-1-phosphate guanylyltransferase/phosphomannomutase
MERILKMKAVILAGGKGSRLDSYTESVPKPLIKIEGKSVLEYQIDSLKKSGLTDIIISIGYLGEKITEYFGDGSKYGVKISYLKEESPLGTGGVLYYLKERIEDDFILLFGDIVLHIDWRKFIEYHHRKNGIGTFLVHSNSHPYDSDLLILDRDDKIINIISKDSLREYYDNIVKSGVHIFRKEILKYAKPEKMDLEKEIIFKAIGDSQRIYGYRTSEYVKDMGTMERLAQVAEDIKKNYLEKKVAYHRRKCIFLDRDGTINKYKGLLSNIDDLELEDGVSEAIQRINRSEYLCIVITNQPVVARNMCTEEELQNIHKKLQTLLGLDGAYLDGLYYCPHHPDRGYEGENKDYKIKCNCRKPRTGMIQAAQQKYYINLDESYMIGDTDVDIQTGKNAGLKTILLKTGECNSKKYDVVPDFVADNLYQAVSNIIL